MRHHMSLSSSLCWVTCFLSLFPSVLVQSSPLETRSYSTHLEERADALPILSLDYGNFQASSYNGTKDIYTFKNIRYAAPPTGSLRWAKPQKPAYNATLSDGSYGNKCIQGSPKGLNLLGSLNKFGWLASIVNSLFGTLLSGLAGSGDEDCLFLDLYVPGSAIRSNSTASLPVVVWIYGGAYVFGDKNQAQPILPLYDGSGPILASMNEMIFITFNYRVGSFGFLAGTTMEQQGVPNAAFYDQRAVFQWVQDYIHLVGGDKTQVTAWGESAGAGSILHHLTAFGGTQDPLFRKAVLESTASELLVDRQGDVQATFNQFATKAGCKNQGLACLRAAKSSALIKANNYIIGSAPVGAFAPGPAADGTWLRQMPALELASGNYWKDMDGLILSHVSDEPNLFVPGNINSNAKFEQLASFIIPSYAPEVLADVISFFPAPGFKSKYKTQTDRTEDYLGTTNFYCNFRYLSSAYAGKTWNTQYSVSPGLHGTDLLPTFYDSSAFGALASHLPANFGSMAMTYQSYLTSFSITGDPNMRSRSNGAIQTIKWPQLQATDTELLYPVLDTNITGFSLITDNLSIKSKCDFFLNVQAAITSKGGYSPPGAVVANNLNVSSNGDPSRNYQTPQ